MPQKKTYKAKVRLYSNKFKRYFEPGEVIDLSHAQEEDIDALLKQGSIEILSDSKPIAAVPEEGDANG